MAATKHIEAMSLLLKSAKYSDLTLICNGHEFPVHRAIVCPHSPFFDAACKGEFQVITRTFRTNIQTKTDSSLQEAHTRRVELQDDDPDTVKCMVSYMYNYDYNDEQHRKPESTQSIDSSNTGGMEEIIDQTAIDSEEGRIPDLEEVQPTLVSSVRVYAIADKYDIPRLKDLARQKFCNWAEKNWACDDFAAIVKEIYESTPNHDQGLRDIVVQLIATHAQILLEKDSVRQLIEDIGVLGLSVLCQLSQNHSDVESTLKSQIETLETDVTVLNRQLEENARGLLRKAQDMDLTMKKISSLVQCRHCKNRFNMDVEAYLYGGAIVRCKGCRTMH
jgi:hypothetical protein